MVRRLAPTVLRSRDGTTLSTTVMGGPSAAEIQALKLFSDSKVTKLVSTGGPLCICLQLYTEGGAATWKQTNVPNMGHAGVLLMPIKGSVHPDRVDTATPPPRMKRTGTTEVVLRGVSKEPDGRARELILYTDNTTGKQQVRYRIQTGGQELTERNAGLTFFSSGTMEAPRQAEAASGADQGTEPEKEKGLRSQDSKE